MTLELKRKTLWGRDGTGWRSDEVGGSINLDVG